MVKKIVLSLLTLIVIILIGGYAYYRIVIYQAPLISTEDRQAVQLMPLPAKLELQNGALDLSKGLKINALNFHNEKIENSINRFIERIGRKTNLDIVNENGVTFDINCLAAPPTEIQQVHEDESYVLRIAPDQLSLEAPSPYGIIRGLETLAQLIKKEGGTYLLPAIEITDAPRFPWRGIMLDVCRHWMPKETVLRTLDAMSAVKMNVFHWHLSDDQGFRVESKAFPRLHKIGSNGKHYTQAEVKEIIDYAADRGIRVVPEFDLPGHSKSWQMAYPELSTVSFPLKFGQIKGSLFAPPIDPSKEVVYEFLDTFMGEMATLFPDQYLHIGGDEVNPKYWSESASVQRFMKEKGMEDTHDLQAYFNLRMHKILKKHGKLMVGWEEILHPDLGDDIIIQAWKSQKILFEGVQQGSSAILSAGYYLDHKLHAGTYYSVDPLVLPGAVDIIPDTANWSMYDMNMEFPMGDIPSQLVMFDRDPQNVYGFFAIMDGRNVFKAGKIEEGTLSFSMSSPMGELGFSGELLKDSINGKLSFGLMKFPAYGSRSGGSDISGSTMPKIEIMKPLTEEQKSRIVGGEAAMWSEVVSAENVDSRLWPNSAAIAEKLWSPQALTTDTEDMYRRLPFISNYLSERGAIHNTQYELMLKHLGGNDGYKALKILVDVLEEVKYYGRLTSLFEIEGLYLPDLPLDGVVDAAKPESFQARSFNMLVDELLADPSNQGFSNEIKKQLEVWSSNHELLKPFINQSEKLRLIAQISSDFSMVSGAALLRMNTIEHRQQIPEKDLSELKEKLIFLEQGEHGMLLPVAPGLKRLIEEL